MIKEKYTKLDITNYYPADINSDENAHRKMSIIVKRMNDVSNISSFLKQVEKLTLNPNADNTKALGGSAIDTGKTLIEQASQSQLNRSKALFNNLKTEWGCALPLPNELNENQSHQWDATEGIVGSTLGGLADTNIIGSLSINKALGEIANKSANRKALINPGYFQDYKGTRPREFNFTWDFIPNSKDEAEQIYNILLRLKQYTLPETLPGSGGLGLSSPYLFDIEVGNWKMRTLMNMNNVVCTNMSIGYSADNALQMYGDGTPKHMTLQMGFAERTTTLASDFIK